MSVTWLKRLLTPTVRTDSRAVLDDAETLIGTHGDHAYAVAADLSWQEDYGLLQTAAAGHWWRVTNEIGRRIGKGDDDRIALPGPRPVQFATGTSAPTSSLYA